MRKNKKVVRIKDIRSFSYSQGMLEQKHNVGTIILATAGEDFLMQHIPNHLEVYDFLTTLSNV